MPERSEQQTADRKALSGFTDDAGTGLTLPIMPRTTPKLCHWAGKQASWKLRSDGIRTSRSFQKSLYASKQLRSELTSGQIANVRVLKHLRPAQK
jgi:hypothetical protein